MSRTDDERIADIVEAAVEIAAVVDRGKTLLAHHHHRVDPEQVWVIASVEVPRLVLALS